MTAMVANREEIRAIDSFETQDRRRRDLESVEKTQLMEFDAVAEVEYVGIVRARVSECVGYGTEAR